jgi:hypothetical protein
MKPNDLAIGLRDLSDTLNACGNDYSDILYTAATQLEQRLLTDAEREAIAAGLGALESIYADAPPISRPIHDAYAPTLRGLLERTK